jgi:hypothetical protein
MKIKQLVLVMNASPILKGFTEYTMGIKLGDNQVLKTTKVIGMIHLSRSLIICRK